MKALKLFIVVFVTLALAETGLAQSKIPACPAGSNGISFKIAARPYISHQCKLPQISNHIGMCLEWEGSGWSPTISVPCGSRVSVAVEYTGRLHCSVDKQIYLWDNATHSISKEISCLPDGWESIQMLALGCPSGYVRGSPALFAQDACYGPRPASRPSKVPSYVQFCPAGSAPMKPESDPNGQIFFLGACTGQPISRGRCADNLQYFEPPYGKGICRAWLDVCPNGYSGTWLSGKPHKGILRCTSTTPGAQPQINRQELLARDINGFALDMTIPQVQALARQQLRSLGRGQFKVTTGGIEYDFGFSVLGHLYRIDSKQILGQFLPDAAFAQNLTRKLTAKFGPPLYNQLPDGPASWEYLEQYRDINGTILSRVTVSLSALLLDDPSEGVSLNMKLMDFRIMRRDISRANASPRSRAEDQTSF